jgi:hypothetical protein
VTAIAHSESSQQAKRSFRFVQLYDALEGVTEDDSGADFTLKMAY